MRPKNFKGGRCIKKKLKKCEDISRTYDKVQMVYAEILENDADIVSFQCNVLLDGLEGREYTSDFVCTKTNGDITVRECVFRRRLTFPKTCKLLDISRDYWLRRGVTDWAIVTEQEAVYEEK